MYWEKIGSAKDIKKHPILLVGCFINLMDELDGVDLTKNVVCLVDSSS